jgi:hypothetical protein
MDNERFLEILKSELKLFSKAVSTNEGEWIIKGFIDVYKNIYTISIDTKIISKVLELLLFPMLEKIAKKNDLLVELCPQQNFYPDISFVDKKGNKFALDIKSTYRNSENSVNGMTLGAFTGYFRNRKSNKNTKYPYSQYNGHFVLGVIYTQTTTAVDERKKYKIEDLSKIPSVINNFEFFAWPKYRIATGRPGSGNTKNIGSVNSISDLRNGTGPFHELGEKIYDDYWMYYLTKDMARALEVQRPYTNLKQYIEYKKRGIDILKVHEDQILKYGEDSKSEKGGEE